MFLVLAMTLCVFFSPTLDARRNRPGDSNVNKPPGQRSKQETYVVADTSTTNSL